jgi:branched-chain amino acid transport system substrate-binding protein
MERTVVLFKISGTPDDLRLELNISSISPDGRKKNKINTRYCNLARIPNSLLDAYQECKDRYLDFGESRSLWTRSITVPSICITNDSLPDFEGSRNNLIREFDRWLNCCNLNNLYRDLVGKVNPDKYKKTPGLVSFVIQTDTMNSDLNFILQRLPWDNSDLLGREHYPNAEIVFSTKAKLIDRVPGKLNAFVICGSNERINVEPDLKALRKHLPKNITLLPPFKGNSLELIQRLSQHSIAEDNEQIHLLFFIGHSASTDTSDIRIYINKTDYISPTNPNFRTVLTDLKNRGLILAFFNSCDGLGIAKELVEIGIPNLIVMKETIHDRTAQNFIGYFLEQWTEANIPIDIAFRRAKFELRFNPETPNGDFLPALFRNHNQPPLILPQSFINRLRSFVKETWKYLKKRPLVSFPPLALFLAGLCLAIGISISKPEAICKFAANEKNISCGEEILLSQSASIEKKQGFDLIKNFDNSAALSTAIKYLEKDWKSSKDKDPETLIAIENAKLSSISSKNPAVKAHISVKNIAVVIPGKSSDTTPRYVSKSILDGVAFAQQQHNQNPNRDWDLRVLIVDDGNDELQAKAIAKKLVDRVDILAVIGHYSSTVTLPILKNNTYKNKVVLISPTATSHELRDRSKFFFRITPQSNISAEGIVRKWVKKDRKIALFHQNGEFSRSLTERFKQKIMEIYKDSWRDILDPDLEFYLENANIEKNIDTAMKNGAKAIVLFPDAYTGKPEIKTEFRNVIKYNSGRLPILGNTSIYDMYDAESQDALNKSQASPYKDVVMSIPWDNYKNMNSLEIKKESRQYNNKLKQIPEWWLINGNIDRLSERTVVAYDSALVLLKALRQANDRIAIQNIIADPDFSIVGITGNISFDKSDRQEKFHSLVTPQCNANTCEGFRRY